MSSRLHLYAIVPPDACSPPAVTRGIRDSTIALEHLGALGVWLSHVAPFGASPADLLAHHRVVEAVCDAGPALPVRFGTSFPDGGALERALAPRTEALLASLGRVGCKREVALTLAWSDDGAESQSAPLSPSVPPAVGPGRRFMAERAAHWSALEARRARATDLETELRQTLSRAGLDAPDVKLRIVPSPRVALSCAVLIEPAESGDVVRRVRERSAGWADVRLHTAGPWPPYSFSDGK